jgi:hypothetical protein
MDIGENEEFVESLVCKIFQNYNSDEQPEEEAEGR